MRRSLLTVVAALAIVATACRSDRIALDYQYEPGQVLEYTLVASASATWDIGGPGRGSYRWVARVTEEVQEVDATGALVEVTLEPTDVEEDGLLSPGSDGKSFSMRIDDKGRVLEVVEVDGVPANALEPEEIAFIGTYRPPLPTEAIRLQEEWSGLPPINATEGFQQLVSSIRLVGLDRDADGRMAEIAYDGESPLARTTRLPEGEAELDGRARISGTAVVDIDGGYLREATTITEGDFDVHAVPTEGGTPVTGSLHQELTLELEKT